MVYHNMVYHNVVGYALEEASQKFKALQEAFEVLSDPAKRQEVDGVDDRPSSYSAYPAYPGGVKTQWPGPRPWPS